MTDKAWARTRAFFSSWTSFSAHCDDDAPIMQRHQTAGQPSAQDLHHRRQCAHTLAPRQRYAGHMGLRDAPCASYPHSDCTDFNRPLSRKGPTEALPDFVSHLRSGRKQNVMFDVMHRSAFVRTSVEKIKASQRPLSSRQDSNGRPKLLQFPSVELSSLFPAAIGAEDNEKASPSTEKLTRIVRQ